MTGDFVKLFVADSTLQDGGATLDNGVRSVRCDIDGDFRLYKELSISVRLVLFRLERPTDTETPASEWAYYNAKSLERDCDGKVIERRVPIKYAKACDEYEAPDNLRYVVTVAEHDVVAYVEAWGAGSGQPLTDQTRSSFKSMVWLGAQSALATA